MSATPPPKPEMSKRNSSPATGEGAPVRRLKPFLAEDSDAAEPVDEDGKGSTPVGQAKASGTSPSSTGAKSIGKGKATAAKSSGKGKAAASSKKDGTDGTDGAGGGKRKSAGDSAGGKTSKGVGGSAGGKPSKSSKKEGGKRIPEKASLC
jgi:hypothetical protein